MAKFELTVYDDNGNVAKTVKRAFMPVGLFIRFQQFSADVMKEKYPSDVEFFAALKDIFVETFPDLTASEYMNNTDVAEVLALWKDVLEKATTALPTANSKNG